MSFTPKQEATRKELREEVRELFPHPKQQRAIRKYLECLAIAMATFPPTITRKGAVRTANHIADHLGLAPEDRFAETLDAYLRHRGKP